jgi:hypothetical protein
LEQRRQRSAAKDGIHHDLERHRAEQSDGTGEQSERQQADEVEPIRSCLPEQAPEECDLAHQASPRRWHRTTSRISAISVS